jgi:hypothetical protein
MLVLSVISLFLGSVLVEILRAAINRVSSAVMGRARRGALVLRLVIVVLVILVFQFVFNFIFLLQLLSGFYVGVASVQFIPLFWASLSVRYLMSDNALLSGLFFAGNVGFTLLLLWIAAKVRTRYWVPVPIAIRVTHAEYKPASAGMLSRFGFSPTERAIIRKDLRGFGRRRELIQFFAIPFVFTAVLVLQTTLGSQSGGGSSGAGLTFPVFFVGAIFSLMMSSISFGQESTAVMNLYSLPISPRELLRAKAFTSLLVSMPATIGLFILTVVLGAVSGTYALIVLCIACVLTVEENFVGLLFGARYPDFQERPRPRFVDPVAIIGAVLLGLLLMLVGALPVFLETIFTSMGVTFYYLVGFSIIFSVAVTVFAYRLANSAVRSLLAEMRK